MKKLISLSLSLFIIVTSYLVINPVYANDDNPNLTITCKQLLSASSFEVTKVIDANKEAILYQARDRLGQSLVNLSVGGKIKLTYPLKVTAFYDGLNVYYLGGLKDSQTLIIAIDKTTYKIKEFFVEADIIKSIDQDGDHFVLSGAKNNDAYIMVANNHFEVLREESFGGDKWEQYDFLIVTDNHYLLGGGKNAHSMENVGNDGEEKVFLSIVSKDLETVTHEYLNFNESFEQIVSFIYQDDFLNVLVKSGNDYYLNQFDKELGYVFSIKVNDLYNFNLNDCHLIAGYNDFLITVFKCGSFISYGVISNTSSKDLGKYALDIKGDILLVRVEDGLLKIICANNDEIYLYQVDNFEENIKTFVGSKEYCPINALDDLEIYSHFGAVTMERKAITPHFSNSISGNYQATYVITLPSGRSVQKIREIVVYPYANVIDGGIYPTDYSLDFFDYAKLNGVSIARNKKITTPGNYTLTLTNNIGELQTINFQVVDNYLKNSSDNIQMVDVMLAKGEDFTLQLPFKTSGTIKSIEINNTTYQNFTYEEGKIIVNLKAPTYEGVYPYVVNKVNCEYFNRQIGESINQVIMVRVMKAKPAINISSSKNFLFNINDEDQTLVDFAINVYDNENLKTTISSSLQNTEFTLNNLVPNHRYHIKLIMKYHLGDGNIYEKSLIEFDTVATTSELDIGSFTILKQNRTLEEASFTLKTEDIQKLRAGAEDIEIPPITNNYQAIIIGIAMLILAIVLGFLINRKHLLKKKNIKN